MYSTPKPACLHIYKIYMQVHVDAHIHIEYISALITAQCDTLSSWLKTSGF